MTPEELEILEVLMSIGMSIDEAMSVLGNIAPVRQPFDFDSQIADVLSQMQQGVTGNHPATYTGKIPQPLPGPIINFNPSVLSEMTNGTMFGPWLASGSVANADGEPWGPRATVFPPSDSDLLASSAMGGDSDVQTWMGDADTGYYAPNSPTGRPEYPIPDGRDRSVRSGLRESIADRRGDAGAMLRDVAPSQPSGMGGSRGLIDFAMELVARGMQGARAKQQSRPQVTSQPGRAEVLRDRQERVSQIQNIAPYTPPVVKNTSVRRPIPPQPAPAPVRSTAITKTVNKAAEPKTSTRGKAR